MGEFSLHIEGWRALPQSFSILCASYCLELLKRREVNLTFTDAPLPPSTFLRVGSWNPTTGIRPDSDEKALAAIPSQEPGARIDATYRISLPYDFTPAPQGRTFVFAVAEGDSLNDEVIRGRRSLREALPQDVTLLTCSERSRKALIASGAAPNRVVTCPLGADTRFFRPIDAERRSVIRTARGIAEDEFVFLHVGALYGWKGTPILLKAFAVVAARHPHVRLMLKGVDAIYASRGSVAQAFAALSSTERALTESKLMYSGATLSTAALADLYRAADVLVSPYRYEGFNLPVLEAAACGTPVICTAGGPTDEFTREDFAWRISSVEEKGGGLNPDIDHLIALMERAIEDRQFRARVEAAGPAFVAQGYTWEKATDRLLTALRSDSFDSNGEPIFKVASPV